VEIIEFLKEYYTVIFVWLTCLTAIFVFRKTLPLPYRWLILLIILLSILETIANAVGFFGRMKNHFVFNILYVIQLTLVPYFFRFWIQRSWIKKVISIFIFIFPLSVLINTLWIQGFFTLHTYNFVIGGSFILFLSVAYLGELYTNDESLNIFSNPVFWFSLAYLIYFAVSVPYLGMLNYLWTNYPKFTTLYYELIFEITNCLYNVLLAIGLLCMRVRPR
jgi:hypothetical protein